MSDSFTSNVYFESPDSAAANQIERETFVDTSIFQANISQMKRLSL